jgi:hypothetical protein
MVIISYYSFQSTSIILIVIFYDSINVIPILFMIIIVSGIVDVITIRITITPESRSVIA